eukprot:scaffold241213_cov18-Tisochrysis_lutea.AAC.2
MDFVQTRMSNDQTLCGRLPLSALSFQTLHLGNGQHTPPSIQDTSKIVPQHVILDEGCMRWNAACNITEEEGIYCLWGVHSVMCDESPPRFSHFKWLQHA